MNILRTYLKLNLTSNVVFYYKFYSVYFVYTLYRFLNLNCTFRHVHIKAIMNFTSL